ncbi:MAG: RluA family pseudouridine synthase [Bulleidia sp.]
MRKTIEITIEQKEDGLALKTVLSKSVGLSRREISRLKFSHGMVLNGREARVTETVHEGDVIELTFPEKDTPHAIRIMNEPEILYEDEDIVIVNKPAGMVCHPSHEHQDDDMGTLLQNYYGSGFTIRAVGRLDKDVSGIMVYAKNQPCAARLSKQRSKEQLHKVYTAIAQGIFDQKSGTLEYRLSKVIGRKDRRVDNTGQLCITDYQVIGEKDDMSLLEISIRTGRTHQIRAGMAQAGHPLCGDELYGGNRDRIDRPALHCGHVELIQPFTKEKITVDCDLPEDMNDLWSI